MPPLESPANGQSPILVLGGGIHGAAVARELILNGVPVVLVDPNDLATGATSKSSRLIHGGLRYLEYGDVRLVRESLDEREKLLALAPQFVKPLRLHVPVQYRWSGMLRSALGFLKLSRTRLGRRLMGRSERRAPRGYWPVRFGLWLYDLFSWADGLPKSRSSTIEAPEAGAARPQVDTTHYRWLCEYSDAQMQYPERCVMALLAETHHIARERGISLLVRTHARVLWQDSTLQISSDTGPRLSVQPAMVINCSGAWGDLTLNGIDAGTTPLFAGTKGSHLVTRHPELKRRLGDQGVYAETGDRRLAFILPFGDAVLVGTTDEKWVGPPDTAVASDEELDYLLEVVDRVFGLKLGRGDIVSHYSGVRPLPRTLDVSTAAISRDHWLAEHRLHGLRIVTLVGGKLTTFRVVAEQITDKILAALGRKRTASTTALKLTGGDDFPRDASTWPALWQRWAFEFGTSSDEVRFLWPLYGMQARTILQEVSGEPTGAVQDLPVMRRTIRWIIKNEWVTTLDDLIERRLMLIFAPRISEAMLRDLAGCLAECEKISEANLPLAIEATRQRLQAHYGRIVED